MAGIDFLSAFPGLPIVVVGDVMLDHFVVGRVDRISPEAPVPIVRFDRDEYRLGGAANVAHNIAALGGQPALIGLVGADEAAKHLREHLLAAGVNPRGLVADASRATTRKVRVVTSRNQQVARIDYEHDTDAKDAVSADLVAAVKTASLDARAVVVSDYRKGVVTDAVIAAAIEASKSAGAPLLVDPKLLQPERYQGASLITPNHHEAEMMTQTVIRSPDDVRRAAQLLHGRTGASVLITWGEHGMWIFDASGDPAVEEHLPAVTREVADVTGAGDTVVAAVAMGLAAGASLVEAARIANQAAGLVVGRFGPAAVSIDELLRGSRQKS
ncbi:MAG TPA: D-glycero-beta-D-manno-heptose-7-phosphate kinase [Vicinamibacterales bacterium]